MANIDKLNHLSDSSQRMQLRLQRVLHKEYSILFGDILTDSTQE